MKNSENLLNRLFEVYLIMEEKLGQYNKRNGRDWQLKCGYGEEWESVGWNSRKKAINWIGISKKNQINRSYHPTQWLHQLHNWKQKRTEGCPTLLEITVTGPNRDGGLSPKKLTSSQNLKSIL